MTITPRRALASIAQPSGSGVRAGTLTCGAAAPFTLESGSRTLDLSFAVNQDLANRSTQTTYVQASLTGRNTAAGTPVTVCATLPTGI